VRTILITGANRGIGLAMTQQLTKRGDRVIAACRVPSEELRATPARIEAGVDVTRHADLETLARKLDGIRLDWLVLNAGVLGSERIGALGEEAAASIRRQFETNALAPLRCVDALLGRLGDGSKIALMTSRMGSIADNTSGGYYGYRMSKAALNAAGASLARDLGPRGIAVFVLHPGHVRTAMTGGDGDVSADESAANLIARLDQLSIAESGSFWHAKGVRLPW
jgi:NAD(P)-dependent dehydrogenase (short-subunit alcohol dehydrogenase family)